ncbi:MAG TPA: hypothetical protein VGF79_03705 [Bacteroidia bacterium]
MKESIAHLHALCEDWKRDLQFYKDEIPVLRKRLEEVVSKNTSDDVLKNVEHFENKFKIMNLNYDELLHDINLKKDTLSGQAEAQAKYINVKMFEKDEEMESSMQDIASDFYDTKKSYYRFLSQVL